MILAAESAECGLACIAMVAAFHGHDVDLNGLRLRFSVSMSGLTLRGMMGLCEQLSLTARPVRLELAALRRLATPAVLHWNLDHYVVLKDPPQSGLRFTIPRRACVA